jgi:lipopolysaccharide transport system permease protein
VRVRRRKLSWAAAQMRTRTTTVPEPTPRPVQPHGDGFRHHTVVHRPLRRLSLHWVPLRTHLSMAGHFGHNYVKKYYLDTFLGFLWIPLRPLADVLLRTVLFGAFLQVSSGGRPYVLFLIVGSIGWFFFEKVSYWGYRSLQYNARYFRALPVPWLPTITGTAVVGAVFSLVYLLLALGVAIYFWIARGTMYLTFGPETLYAFVGLGLLLLLGWTFSLFLGPIVRVTRDVRLLIPYPLAFLYILTPVVYTVDSMPENYRAIALYNPLTAPIELIRHGLLNMGLPHTASVLTCLGVLAVTMPIGLFVFARAERATHVRL